MVLTMPGSTPAASKRMIAARPQSIMMFCAPACTKVHGPARFGSGMGLPVPSKVIFMPPSCHKWQYI